MVANKQELMDAVKFWLMEDAPHFEGFWRKIQEAHVGNLDISESWSFI